MAAILINTALFRVSGGFRACKTLISQAFIFSQPVNQTQLIDSGWHDFYDSAVIGSRDLALGPRAPSG